MSGRADCCNYTSYDQLLSGWVVNDSVCTVVWLWCSVNSSTQYTFDTMWWHEPKQNPFYIENLKVAQLQECQTSSGWQPGLICASGDMTYAVPAYQQFISRDKNVSFITKVSMQEPVIWVALFQLSDLQFAGFP